MRAVSSRKIDENKPLEELHWFDVQSWQSWIWPIWVALTACQHVWVLLPPWATQPLLICVVPGVSPMRWLDFYSVAWENIFESNVPGTRTLKQVHRTLNGSKLTAFRRLLPGCVVSSVTLESDSVDLVTSSVPCCWVKFQLKTFIKY